MSEVSQSRRQTKRWLLPIVAAMSTVLLIDPGYAAPDVTKFYWRADETHCRFVRAGAAAGSAEPDRFIFVTQIVQDDIASAERGYARLDGLFRELAFLWRLKTANGEQRRYRTFGPSPITVEIDMRGGDSEKSKLGQTVFVNYTGTITVIQGHALRIVPFSGSCGNKPES